MIPLPLAEKETFRSEDTNPMARSPRAPMSNNRRAKQFAPFDALKGLKEAIAEKERIPTPRRILAEDALTELNQQLSQLRKGDMVTVVYYCIYEQEYHQITGAVASVDCYWSLLQVGSISIDFAEIAEIEIIAKPV